MLRVIGGRLKRRRLYTAKGQHIRPTADRIREALFNILADQIQGANVLELFAGTGALSIEALSRGAAKSLMIDKSARSVAVIQRNIQVCALEDRATVIKMDVRQNLRRVLTTFQPFNLILMDPPYHQGLIKPAFLNVHKSGKLEKNALLVLEHEREEIQPTEIYGFKCRDQRKYGKTLVSFFRYML
jgi:16S rRNA (guanine966-N2)-methyltransferase